MVLEVRIKNQAMYLFPSIEEARFQLMQQMFAWQAIVTSQQRLQSSRYQVGLDKPTVETYKHLLTKLPDGSSVLANAYQAIEQKISEVKNFKINNNKPNLIILVSSFYFNCFAISCIP